MGFMKELFILGLLCFLGRCASSCKLGFSRVGKNCVDNNECTQGLPPCGDNAECSNTIGSYFCYCRDGFMNAKGPNLTFTQQNGQCKDINECTSQEYNFCDPLAFCTNLIGSYKCTCQSGYVNVNDSVNIKGRCQDINECTQDPTLCGDHAKCFNTNGNYFCQCIDGFRNVKGSNLTFTQQNGQCKDINECQEAERNDENICGLSGECENRNGSFWCHCPQGYTNYGSEGIACSKSNCDRFNANSNSGESFAGLADISTMMENSCLALSNSSSASEGKVDGEVLLEKLFTGTEQILSPGNLSSSEDVSGLLSIVENSVLFIGPQLRQNRKLATTETDAEIAVQRGRTPPTGPILIANEDAQLDTDWTTATGTGPYKGFALAALVTYKNLGESMNGFFEGMEKYERDGEDPSFQVSSRVVSVVVSNPSTQNLSRPVNITLRHLEEREESDQVRYICAYWNERGTWATDGCSELQSTATHTLCTCQHLSSFAVLMALYPMEPNFGLLLVTKIGLTLSLVCLILCILTFKFCHSIQGTRTTIHLHLCISLFMADLVFLAGISQTKPEGGCKFVAALLHFFFLAVFAWMLLEGVQLYRMVVLVFNATIRPLYLYVTGYGLPLVIVILSAIIRPNGYGTKQHCWLSLKDGLIWSFFGPVCFIIILNVFFFIVTVWKLAQKFTSLNPDLSKLHKIRAFTVTAIAQMCILGLMWVFGAFLFQKDSIVVAYIFTILNSLQGALVFILHCLLSKQVREEYASFFSCVCTPEKKRYSDFSSTNPSSSQSQGSRSGQITGESQI